MAFLWWTMPGCIGALVGYYAVRRLAGLLILPSMFLSQQNKAQLRAARERAQRTHDTALRSVALRTHDGVELDGVEWHNSAATQLGGAPWLLWLNPNGVAYEEMLPFLVDYARALDSNFLAFNYRCVGESQRAQPTCSNDLFLDADAAMKHLIAERGVPAERVLVHGHSLGAGIGAVLRLSYPGPFVHDRSFSALSTCAASLFGNGVLGGAASLAVRVLNWEMDALANWPHLSGRKAIIYHRGDAMMHYERCSLHGRLDAATRDDAVTPTHSLELELWVNRTREPSQLYHCYTLNMHPPDWQRTVQLARSLLYTNEGRSTSHIATL